MDIEVPDTLDAWNAAGTDYLPGLLGMRFRKVEADEVVVALEVRRALGAWNGYLHAGTVTSLADTCCGYGTVRGLPAGAGGFTTVELKANLIGTAREGTVVCTARPIHKGRTTQVWGAVVARERRCRHRPFPQHAADPMASSLTARGGRTLARSSNIGASATASRWHESRLLASTVIVMSVFASILDSIGGTPLVELRKIVPPGSARVVVKLEGANPTGNMKDRMAKAAIEAAERDGRLRPGGTVVEYTGGSTGASLALVCAAKGYHAKIVTSDAFSDEKTRTTQTFGAEITLIPSEGGKIDERLTRKMIHAARQISSAPGHWWFDQLNNGDAAIGYYSMGEEIWQQANGRVDAFVQSVGSAHSLNGVTRVLRAHQPDLYVVAAEPAESAVLSGGPKGSHRIEGIGIGFAPPNWAPNVVDEIQSATTEEAIQMCRRLAREEGIFAGTSSGLNVMAALRVAERLGPNATVATIMIDSGLRYLSTGLYRLGPIDWQSHTVAG